MDVFDAALLGAVQGAAEFLPVSSSVHLKFAQQLLRASEGVPFFVLLHLPTLFCIACFYPRELPRLFSTRRRELLLIVLATIPAAVTGYLLRDTIDSAFESKVFAGIGLIFTAVALFSAHVFGGGQRSLASLGIGGALLVGLMQVGAPMPGVSRLGMCLSACLLLRIAAGEAVRFSIFLSIPLTLGAALLKHRQIVQLCAETKPILIVASGGAAIALGVCALWLLQRLCQTRRLWFVACYCVVVGALAIAFSV